MNNMRNKIFSLLVLLVAAVSGAWAQDTYKIDAVYTLTVSGQSQSQDLSIDDASLPFTKNLSELDPYSSFWKENNYDANYITVSGDNIEKGTDANWDTEITINGAGTATVSYAIQLTGYVDVGTATITFTVTKNEAPAATTNYYLVGNMNGWTPDSKYKLTENPGASGEYMITLYLDADDEFKIVYSENGTTATTWYPDGIDNNKKIDASERYTVYFRPNYSGGGDWHYNCIYVASDPLYATPTGNKNEWTLDMPDCDVELEIEYETDLTLNEVDDNAEKLTEWNGYEANVTLTRTLATGSWNTFAAPFSTGIPDGWTVKELSSATFADGTLTLNFANAASIEAGKPYLVKVTADVVNPTFSGVTVSSTAVPNTETEAVNFIPTLGATTLPAGDPKSVLLMTSGNTLKSPSALPANIKGFRAYFQLKGDAVNAASFNLDLGEGETTGLNLTPSLSQGEGACFDLQGRKVAQPKKGLYIQNGKKLIIK